ncbi:hypothetical protein RND71_028028 [Anisodus tanguticus]|uniref:Pectinesterase inhibitor domain-containing protein n=1 Tax=Anisodus tanguticus TaxID=243964 RepID=A0AAE1V9Q0_9SOLA|nr:hypothetical protein RND71_028028 [Anisodus tanguticus]
MSSLSNVSILATFILASLLSSLPRTIATLEPNSPKLLKNACTGYTKGWSSSFCLEIMKSNPQIVLTHDLLHLTISIIETGLINATRTQIYIEEKLKENIQESRRAIDQCHKLYDHIIGLYKGALIHVEKHKLYDVAGAEFSMAANNAEYCENWLAISGVIDADISSGNKIIEYLSLSGYTVVIDLMITDWVTKRK